MQAHYFDYGWNMELGETAMPDSASAQKLRRLVRADRNRGRLIERRFTVQARTISVRRHYCAFFSGVNKNSTRRQSAASALHNVPS
jgi:hypothetical protein